MDLQISKCVPQCSRLVTHPTRGRKMTAPHRPTFQPQIYSAENVAGDRQRWVFVPDVVADDPTFFTERRAFEVLWTPPDFEGGTEFFASPVA